MKNTSILIPIILIGCLAALGFLFYTALQTVDEDRGRGNNPIVLNEADYAAEPTPTDVGATTDYDAAAVTPDKKDDDILARQAAREKSEEEARLAKAAELARQEEADRIKANNKTSPAKTSNTNFDTATEPSGSGRYLVIAGSFRQRENASLRVAALKNAGFADTRLEKFNRGTFAVALAGQSNRFSEAETLAGKIVAAGFEAKVMRRR